MGNGASGDGRSRSPCRPSCPTRPPSTSEGSGPPSLFLITASISARREAGHRVRSPCAATGPRMVPSGAAPSAQRPGATAL